MGAKTSSRSGTTRDRKPGGRRTSSTGFSEAEKAAMRERAKELKAGKVDGEAAILAKLATMPPAERTMGERLHALIRSAAPGLVPRLWYGMPAYSKDGDVLCFYRNASKFGTRYGTLGFSDSANLDEGRMWPTDFALKELSVEEEARITALVKRAVG